MKTRPGATSGEEGMTAKTAGVTRRVGRAVGGSVGWTRILKAAVAATTKIDAAGLRRTKRPRPDGDGSERQRAEADHGMAGGSDGRGAARLLNAAMTAATN